MEICRSVIGIGRYCKYLLCPWSIVLTDRPTDRLHLFALSESHTPVAPIHLDNNFRDCATNKGQQRQSNQRECNKSNTWRQSNDGVCKRTGYFQRCHSKKIKNLVGPKKKTRKPKVTF